MEPVTVAALIGGATTIAGTLGAWIHGNNKVNKECAAHQEERSRLQKQIEELLKKIAEKDKIILDLQKRIKQLSEQILAETQRRRQLLEMIDTLTKRQEQLESILTALVAFITFRLGQWKRDKIQLRQALLAAHNDKDTVEALLASIEEQKNQFENKFTLESSQRDELYMAHTKLTEEYDKIGA